MSQAFERLFKPLTIKNLTLKNRIVMASMNDCGADAEGNITQRQIDYYTERAKGGVALVKTGYTYITPRGQAQPVQTACYDERQIPMLKKLVESVHSAGAKIGIQICHGGRQSTQWDPGFVPEAPSPIPCLLIQKTPEEMSTERVREVIELYGEAARIGKEAGFDVVELHGGHGYLVTQFWSPLANKRTDEYGGSFENRLRFAREVIAAIRKRIGDDMVLGCKISVDEFVDGGLTVKDSQKIAKDLEAHEIDYITASAAIYSPTISPMVAPMGFPLGLLETLAASIKEAVDIPVGVIGSINDPYLAENILKRNTGDFIVVGRQFICDPEWVQKAKEGRTEDIRTCIRCNQGCVERILDGLNITYYYELIIL